MTRPIETTAITASMLATLVASGLGDLIDTLEMCSVDSYPATTPGAGNPPGGKGGVGNPTLATYIRLEQSGDTAAQDLRILTAAILAMSQAAGIAADVRKRWIGDGRIAAAPESRGLRKCCNANGCPDDKWAEPGRAGRCYQCWHYHRTHDRDRTTRYPHKVAVITKATPTYDRINPGAKLDQEPAA